MFLPYSGNYLFFLVFVIVFPSLCYIQEANNEWHCGAYDFKPSVPLINISISLPHFLYPSSSIFLYRSSERLHFLWTASAWLLCRIRSNASKGKSPLWVQSWWLGSSTSYHTGLPCPFGWAKPFHEKDKFPPKAFTFLSYFFRSWTRIITLTYLTPFISCQHYGTCSSRSSV